MSDRNETPGSSWGTMFVIASLIAIAGHMVGCHRGCSHHDKDAPRKCRLGQYAIESPAPAGWVCVTTECVESACMLDKGKTCTCGPQHEMVHSVDIIKCLCPSPDSTPE